MGDIISGIVALVIAAFAGWVLKARADRQKEKLRRERNRAIRDAAEQEAESQDDQALIDRITRDRGSQ